MVVKRVTFCTSRRQKDAVLINRTLSQSILYAHTLPECDESVWEPLTRHLKEVAEIAAVYASAFGARDWGEILGQCHDLGKGSAEFQQYLRRSNDSANAGAEDNNLGTRVDHSTFGARYVSKQIGGWKGRLLAFALAGHHTGLPDDVAEEAGERATLTNRLDPARRDLPYVDDPGLNFPAITVPWQISTPEQAAWSLAFFTRMIFSCLIDADRGCTEAFCEPDRSKDRSEPRATLSELEFALTGYLTKLSATAPASPVNACRAEVLQDSLGAASLEAGFFSLQVPTGGGKTLSSLAFALRHAEFHSGMRRVIVAIPFTSIIEQTADVYRQALGEMADRAVVEHHTNLSPLRDTRANQLGTENWDAPLIVTTNVQFLESLFAAGPTPCRKLHRIAGSIIILDEAQTIPVDLLTPTLAALRELVDHYRCSVVLCTATQPALEQRSEFPQGLSGVRQIIPSPERLFSRLKRVEVRNVGRLTDSELAERLVANSQVLCIVNTRRHASDLFDRLAAQAPGSAFHLSTLMCGAHRRAVLSIIKERLRSRQLCQIVSTQLIEAGVDIDLPVVYRAAAGFDSIAQAAGRCNREGRLAVGETYVFDAEQDPPPGILREAAQCAKELRSLWQDPLLPGAVREYFQRFYWGRRDRWDAKNILSMFSLDLYRGTTRFQFREAEDAYRLIDDRALPILIPYDEKAKGFLRALANGQVEYVSQRYLQPYLVSVPERTLRSLENAGIVQAHESGVYLLIRQDAYSDKRGLRLEPLQLDPSLWGV